MSDANKTIYLIDASIYIFRSWFSLPDALTGTEGKPVNAVYGFLRFITDFLEQTRPSHIVFAFDGSLSSSFRNEIFAGYKANREPTPVDLKQQFELCRALVSALGMRALIHDRYEADDLIATVAATTRNSGFRSVVVSADKDLAQIVVDQDLWWNFPKSDGMNADGVQERFGVRPHQIRDYLALVGDSVDNIPGVPGIGAKSAVRLLRLYPSLESIYENLPQVSQTAIRGAAKIAANLQQHREQVFVSRQLATLVTDCDLAGDAGDYRPQEMDQAELDRLIRLIDRGGGFIDRIKQVL